VEFKKALIGKCGIYCGACKLYILKKCGGCSIAGAKCPYFKCVNNKRITSCGECEEFPCQTHYGSMAVYATKFLDWRKGEIEKQTHKAN